MQMNLMFLKERQAKLWFLGAHYISSTIDKDLNINSMHSTTTLAMRKKKYGHALKLSRKKSNCIYVYAKKKS